MVERETQSFQYEIDNDEKLSNSPPSSKLGDEDITRCESNLDSVPQREDKSTLSPRTFANKYEINNIEQKISSSLHKSKLKLLKKQIKACNRTNESQLKQIKELSDLYSLSLERN